MRNLLRGSCGQRAAVTNTPRARVPRRGRFSLLERADAAPVPNGLGEHGRCDVARALRSRTPAPHADYCAARPGDPQEAKTSVLSRNLRPRRPVCQETVMTVQPVPARWRPGEANARQTSGEGGAIGALPGRRAGADGRRYPTAAPDVEIEGAGQGHEGRRADHQEHEAPALRETTQVDSGDRAVWQSHRLPAPRQLVSATQSDRLDRQRHCLLPIVQQPAADDAGVGADLATDLRAPRLSQRRRDIRAGQWGRGSQRDVAVAAGEQQAERDSEATAYLFNHPAATGPGHRTAAEPSLEDVPRGNGASQERSAEEKGAPQREPPLLKVLDREAGDAYPLSPPGLLLSVAIRHRRHRQHDIRVFRADDIPTHTRDTGADITGEGVGAVPGQLCRNPGPYLRLGRAQGLVEIASRKQSAGDHCKNPVHSL